MAPVQPDVQHRAHRVGWVILFFSVLSVISVLIVASVRANQPSGPAADANSYLGSAACQRCHETEYASWRRTLHVQMTKPIAEATVEGAFGDDRPVRFEAYGRSYAMEKRDGRYFVSVAHGSRPPEKFAVDYTLGARRFQGYLSKLPDGRIYVLPVFWHNESKRWLDWKEITPIPNDPDHDLRQIWNVTCVNCHATNLAKNYDVATKTYRTTWTEMGIGCEACHGPGQAHVTIEDEWAKSPETKPAFDNSAKNRDLGRILRIFSPRSAAPRDVFDTCGYCHGNKNNVFFGFRPGSRYEDFAVPFLVSEPIPDNDPQGDFWPDGRPNRFNRPQAIMQTGCFQRGQATCTNCHTAHGSKNSHALKVEVEIPGGGHTKQSDGLCAQCHAPISAKLSDHTHHAADSQGSRCVECHMSDVNWRLITRRRDHTFQPPVPELTARYGEPNACTTCHDDKSPEWAADVMDRWYGNSDRRRAVVAMADTMYRAAAGDTTVTADVAHLAVDRSRSATIRASAAEFVGQLLARGSRSSEPPSPAGTIVNSLIGAAADPEAIVRITAVRSLAAVDDPRVLPVLAAHLADPARVVRVRAAEGLLRRNVVQLEGAAGQALARAQDELAESLRTFNDVSADHATLGWLEAQRGRGDVGTAELRTAIDLDPRDARPHVYLGVLAARNGQYDEALQHWKTAQKLAPDYPNLDRLIEEAQKRLPPRE
jgi:predicted CXXCH cytochrome family protein